MLLALILVGGGIEGKAQETKTFSFAQTSTKAGTLTDAPTGVTATFNNTYTTKDQLIANNSMTLTISGLAEGTKITGVNLDVHNNKSKGNGTATVKLGDATLGTLSVTGLGATYLSKDIPSFTTGTVAAGQDLVITISATQNSVYCDKFTISYQAASGKKATTLSFGDNADKTFTLNATEGTTFTNAATLTPAIDGAIISYSSDNENIAVVDTKGEVRVVTDKEGTATITATYAGNDEYDAATASYKITVVDPSKTTWSYTFKSGDLDGKTTSYTFNNVAWNFNPTWKSNAYIGNLVDDGLQLGSAKNPATSLVFSSTGFPGIVKSVKVNAATASDANATLAVTVGGVSFGEPVNLTESSADYTFTGSAKGEVVITMSQASTSKALYIKSIEIEYNPNAKVATIDENSTAKDFAAGTYNMITLKRTFNDGAWNTLVVPFDLTAEQIKEAFGSTAKVAAYNGATANADNTYTLKFTEATAISANVPVFIYGAENKAAGYSFNDVEVKDATPTQEAEGFNFVGTYVKTTVPVGNVFINAKNVLYKAGDSQTSISGTRATFAPIGAAASAKGFGFTVNDGGQTTAINAVTMQEEANSNEPVYNLAGQRVSKAYKGVVIQNGKKFIQK